MCRFTFYRGLPIRLSALVTEPANSLIHQSFHAHERVEPLNGDGFGLAWYVPGMREPGLFRSITPAWSNTNLMDLARVVSSHCILAHVRASTAQHDVSEGNCHPFRNGSFAFMHNGRIACFRTIRRRLLAELSNEAFDAIGGTTDSEHVFALFLDEWRRRGEPREVAGIAEALEGAISTVMRLVREVDGAWECTLNIVVSDGESGAACRFTSGAPHEANSLYVNEGGHYLCEEGVGRLTRGGVHQAVLVSSEPLSEDTGWRRVPVNHIVTIGPDLAVLTRPMHVDGVTANP